ncbi:MAG: hypothetical protein D6B28_01110 [Gammaproteobacteria bacterium]|nr:MAG: hypothetical protein D6B28_01110 [Gammaproteobacteria bacterium]
MSCNIKNNGKRQVIKTTGFIMLMLLVLNEANAAQGKLVQRQRYVPGEILVKFKDGVADRQKSQVRRERVGQQQQSRFRAQLLKKLDASGIERWKLDGSQSVEQLQKELSNASEVEYAEPNYYMYPLATIPNDLYYTRQWGLNNTGQTLNNVAGNAGSDIEMEEAWDIQTGLNTVNVAIVDDGVQTAHPDLAGNIGSGRDIISSDNNANPHNPTVSTHGTNVAGVIGAVGNNNTGIAGVAWDVNLMPVLFADDSGGNVADAVDAFSWARNNGAHIINYSYGAMDFSQSLADSVDSLETNGILLVVPAGNGDVNNEYVPLYPSNFSNDNIISVAASNQGDNLASWSQYGFATVDVMAPGENICTTSTASEYTCTDSDIVDGNENNDYTDGTSFAAPYVAGLAALIKSQYPAADFQEIKGRIMAGVDAKTTARDRVAAGGRINAENSLIVAESEVLVISSVTVDASGNEVIDPEETADLVISIENAWADSTNVSAVLSTTDGEISIADNSKTYGNIAEGAAASATFSITLGDVSGYRKIPFQLDVTADGYAVTRYFDLVTGQLENNVLTNGTIQTDAYDDVHYYHFTVPSNATSLSVTTTSDENIDLFLMKGGKPPVAYWGDNYDSDENATILESKEASGDETITVTDPEAGEYFVAVYNYGGVINAAYSIERQVATSGSGVIGGGGGSFPISLLLVLGGIVLVYRRN